MFESWTYLVSKWTVDALLNKRIDLIKKEEEEGAATAAPTGAFGGPGGPPAPDMSTLPANIQEQIRAMQEQAAGSAVPSTIEEALEELPTGNVDEAIDAVTNPLPSPEE